MPAPIISDNAAELIALLEAETDPHRRATLTDLLILEENEIARARGRQALAQAVVKRGREHVRRQRALLAMLARDDPRRPLAERTLENMLRLQNLFEAHRRLFVDDSARRHWRSALWARPPHFGDP